MIARIVLFAAGSLCIAGTFAYRVRAQETPPAPPRPHALISHPRRPVTLAVHTDPFVALTQEKTAVAGTTFAVTGAPGGPHVTIPTPQTTASVVLCATWPNTTDGHVPTAVFYVGKDAIVAGPGDDVGGYSLATVARDGVSFATGEHLAIADCSGLGGDQADGTADAQVQAPGNATIAPGQSMPSEIPSPSAGQPFVPAPAATPLPNTSSPFGSGYQDGNAGASYGSTTYDGPAPSPRPYPYLPPTGIPHATGTPSQQ